MPWSGSSRSAAVAARKAKGGQGRYSKPIPDADWQKLRATLGREKEQRDRVSSRAAKDVAASAPKPKKFGSVYDSITGFKSRR